MRNLQWLLLMASVAVGIIWIFICQNWLFLNIFPGLLIGNGLPLIAFLQTGSSPAFTVFWAGCITALMIWIGVTWSSQPYSSKQTRQMQLFGGLLLVCFSFLDCFVCVGSPSSNGKSSEPVLFKGDQILFQFLEADGCC